MSNFAFNWKLSDLEKVKTNGLKVFSCFSCGGGSSMGYKMSGFDLLGCNEIDPKMISVYKKNLKPRLAFLESITTFHKRNDLPPELFDLDILDGSPPCSSFSMAGKREKHWGETKKFREGQAKQVLDDLFFEYIALVDKLRPKVFVAENVKGLISGNAKGYAREILRQFDKAGYKVQMFLLNAATMGVPQKRNRVFFIGHQKAIPFSPLRLAFNEPLISVGKAFDSIPDECEKGKPLSPNTTNLWTLCKDGEYLSTVHPTGNWFTHWKASPKKVCPTIISGNNFMRWDDPRWFSDAELCVLGSFPLDYRFVGATANYLIGMSVPPIMVHKISQQIQQQWFSK